MFAHIGFFLLFCNLDSVTKNKTLWQTQQKMRICVV